MYSSTLSLTSVLDEVGGQCQAPAALPPVKTRYPLYRRLGTPQGRSGQVRKFSPPPGFNPRTVQPVASRYIDCAIPSSNKLLQFLVQTNETITYLHTRHVAAIRLPQGHQNMLNITSGVRPKS